MTITDSPSCNGILSCREANRKEEVPLDINNSNFDQFVYTFPGNLPLEEGFL